MAKARAQLKAKAPLKAGVIGHPVSHSISPLIFEFLSRKLKKEIEYERIEIAPEDLAGVLRNAKKERPYLGWNVTIPHKQTIARKVDRLSPEARCMGAVNVAHFTPKGLVGHNTDIIGIDETLIEQRFDAKYSTVLIFGAGGAAVAVAYALARKGALLVYIANRTIESAESICRKLHKIFPRTFFIPITPERVDVKIASYLDLVVNATPLGMKGFPKRSVFDPRLEQITAPKALAFDLIYRPENTPFLRSARKHGLRTVGGLDMLIWQAIGTWEIWFGPIPKDKRKRLKSALKTHLRKKIGK